jgi:DNA primase
MSDVADILQQVGYQLIDYGKEYRTKPLYRPSDNATSLCIKKTTGEWYDFSERVGGSLDLLIQKTVGDIPPEIRDKILSGAFFSRKEAVELTDIKTFDKSLLIKLNKNHEYWLNRGVSAHTINLFEGGTTTNGRMAHRYVFPIFNERKDLVGFSGRILAKNSNSPKWKHLGKKSHWCYPAFLNEETILNKKEVILVESIGDMLALFDAGIENVLVAFGVDIGPKLIEFLLKADINRIYIAFNNDKDNNFVGNEAAEEGRKQLIHYFDENQVMLALPETKNDFGEMSHNEILLWKENLNQKLSQLQE